MITLTDSSKDLIKRKGIILVDFYATWCGPCKIMLRNLIGVERSIRDDKILIAKVDVEKNPLLESEFDITNLPTLILFKDGRDIGQLYGSKAGKHIQQFITDSINADLKSD